MDSIVCSSDEDDADADADDDMDPRHFVQAQLTKPEIAIIDLTEDSQMAVAEPELELQQEPTQFRGNLSDSDFIFKCFDFFLFGSTEYVYAIECHLN